MNRHTNNGQLLGGASVWRQDLALPEGSFGLVGDWGAEIKRLWAERRSNTIELARVVYAAKRKLMYGQWTHLLKSRQIPLAKRTAEMLVIIAKGLGNLDAQGCAHLPSALNTLYALAQLDRSALVGLMAAGLIHPALTVREAKELLARRTLARDGHRSRSQIRRRLSAFMEFVRMTLPQWVPSERAQVCADLKELLEEVGTPLVPNHHRQPLFKETSP